MLNVLIIKRYYYHLVEINKLGMCAKKNKIVKIIKNDYDLCGFSFLVSYMVERAANADEETRISHYAVGKRKADLFFRPLILMRLFVFLVVFGFGFSAYAEDYYSANKTFDVDIPALDVAQALNRLADQTGVTFLFPYEVARSRPANAVVGRYTIEDALTILLKHSGLSGGLSNQGVIEITLSGDERLHFNREGNGMSAKKSMLIALLGVFGANSVLAEGGVEAEAGENYVLEEVVVSGIRRSLKKAMDIKRDSVGVVDGIASEDLSKFPDMNISEALQRITGVTIDRSSSGEGSQINVRGLPPEFTRVTVNGMTAATGDEGRNFNFDVFASELFSNVTLTKTPSADMTEGGLAGTVNMQMPRPFDFNEPQLVVSASGQKAELDGGEIEDGIDPRYSMLFTDTFAEDKVGVLFSAAYSESTIRGDTTEGRRFESMARGGWDPADPDSPARTIELTENGSTQTITDIDELVALSERVYVPVLPRFGPDIITRERLGLTSSFQFQPTDTLQLGLDVLYATFDDDLFRSVRDSRPGLGGRGHTPIAISVFDDFALVGTFDDITQRSETQDHKIDTTFSLVSLSGDWQFADNWTASTVVGYSEAEEKEEFLAYIWTYDGSNGSLFNYDLTNEKYPNLDGMGFDPTNPDLYFMDQLRNQPRKRDDRNFDAQVDFEYMFEAQALSSIKFGLQYRNRTKGQIQKRIRPNGDPAVSFSDYSMQLPVGDFLDDAPGNIPFDFLVTDVDKARGLFSSDDIPLLRPLATFDVNEEVISGYIKTDWQLELAGKDLVVDAGVRYVITDSTSLGNSDEDGVIVPISISNTYNDVLPSINARINLQDDLVLRMSVNQAMTRPTLTDLNPGLDIDPSASKASGGNPELDPFRATQFDVSLEWYFADESLISAGYFYKDMDSFIANVLQSEILTGSNLFNGAGENVSGTEFAVTRPVNGDDGELSGFEVSYQQPFTFLPDPFDGFGTLINATFSDSEGSITLSDGTKLRTNIAGQSDLSYNVVFYYERGGFSARYAWSYRDDYLLNYDRELPRRVDKREQADISINYDFDEKLSISFDALNINGADHYEYQVNPANNGTYIDQGAVYTLGARYKIF